MNGAMPLFYFHVRTRSTFIEDDIGHELPDLDAVRTEGELGARGILAEDLKAGRPLSFDQFEVADSTGRIVHVYPFIDAIKLH